MLTFLLSCIVFIGLKLLRVQVFEKANKHRSCMKLFYYPKCQTTPPPKKKNQKQQTKQTSDI